MILFEFNYVATIIFVVVYVGEFMLIMFLKLLWLNYVVIIEVKYD